LHLATSVKEGQPHSVLNLVTITCQPPGHYHPLYPGTWTKQLPARIRQLDLCWIDAHSKRGQWQRTEVAIEQPCAVGKTGIAVAEKSIEARTITGVGDSVQRISCRPDEVEPRAPRRRWSCLDR